MRNQSLLHRQLGMLDSMERRTSEPGALADLFRLDHLTTRMRRHAEGLIILSGSTPGRGWREPVPVVDVLRAAVAEVEDYVRVDVLSESRDLVAGNAVNDVIHLVAELVENATVFSPPNTRIEVRADRAGTGLVAEIEDRGLGLSEDELADINRRLASPPEFDLANSEQLGLFVVSRLAARHAHQGGAAPVDLRGHDGHPRAAVRRDRARGRGRIARRPQRLARGQRPPVRRDGGSGPATGPLPAFGATGRHRLPSAATGRRADTGVAGRDESRTGLQRHGLCPGRRGSTRSPSRRHRSSRRRRSHPSGSRHGSTETAAPWPDPFNRGAGAGSPRARPRMRPRPRQRRRAASRRPAWRRRAVISGCRSGSRRPAWRRSCGAAATSGQQDAGSVAPRIDERSPEATRNMMILMQQGLGARARRRSGRSGGHLRQRN